MAFEITSERRQQVERLAGLGLTVEQVGHVLGTSADTIGRRFKVELERGRATALAAVAGNLHRMAMGDGREAVTAAIFYLKTRGRWREAPAEVELQVSASGTAPRRSVAELETFARQWARVAGPAVEVEAEAGG
jgi:hypothetical protein